jgi:hypothetical protein
LFGPWALRLAKRRAKALRGRIDYSIAYWYLAIGLLCFFVLIPIFHGRATITSLVTSGWNLMTVGLNLCCFIAWRQRHRKEFFVWLMTAAALPIVTIVTWGYAASGVIALLTTVAFVGTFYKPRSRYVLVCVAGIYLALSMYQGYMRDRADIRAEVWGGGSLSVRATQVAEMLWNVEWFNPFNTTHLARIDERLNQNYLVGVAVQQRHFGVTQYAKGETLWQAVQSLVPRVLWPEKPMVAGSMDLVERYTGIPTAPDTSVGIGQVMEFYVNFGTLGVVCGFFVVGVILSVVDASCFESLSSGQQKSFALWYLPGLSLIRVGGSFVDVVSSAGAAAVLMIGINRFVVPRFRARFPLQDETRRTRSGARAIERGNSKARSFRGQRSRAT